MKSPRLKYNASELASLTILLAVAGILAAVLLARSCGNSHAAGTHTDQSAADSIAALIDSVNIVDHGTASSPKNKGRSNNAAVRQPVSRDYLDEPVNE